MGGTEGTYVIAAGRRGGHIFRGIARAGETRARRPDSKILFVGTPGGLEHRVVPEAGFPIESVRAAGFVGRSRVQQLRALATLPAGFFAARRILRRSRARGVAGMGGYVSIPVVAAARSLGIATLIHDSDARPGVANQLLNRIATVTALGWDAAKTHLSRPAVVTGTPVRAEFFSVPPLSDDASTRRVLVFGGSQGAVVINRAMAGAARPPARGAPEGIHPTGGKKLAPAGAL